MNNIALTLVFSVASALVIVTPLIISLVEYIKKAINERNWKKLIKLVTDLISTAETMFNTGAERKEWVMGMIQTTESNLLNVDIDEE